MLSALCISGVFSFFEFLKTAVFAVRIYSRRKFISRTIITGGRKKLYRADGKRGWWSKKYFDREKLKISSTCC